MVVHFYFTTYSPGFPSEIFNPRFTLAGLAFSPDEGPEQVKQAIFRTQYTSLLYFILPFNQKAAAYFDTVNAAHRGTIIPATRTRPKLEAAHVLDGLTPEDLKDVDRFNVALGLAGFLDRPLTAEVARAEVSLVRHALALRRLVLRYVEALIALVWTTLASFVALSVVSGLQNLLPKWVADSKLIAAVLPLGFALPYLVWAIVTPMAVRLPMRWLQSLNHTADPVSDPELVKFERAVSRLSIGSVLSVLVALVLILMFAFSR